MSDNPGEPTRQETEADRPSQAAPTVTQRVSIKPKYIQVLGGAMVFAGTFMTWVVLSEGYSRRGIDVIADITGLPLFLGGPLIVLAALLPSRTSGTRGSRLAAVLGLLAFLYVGYEAMMIGRLRGASVGVGVWVCLLGGLLAMAGGWLKNPGAQPQAATATQPAKRLDVPVVQKTDATGTSVTATQATAKILMKPKYIQALGGTLMVVGSFMPWVFISAQYSLTGVQLFTGLPVLLGGALIVLAALFTSDAPGAQGRWKAALIGLLALLYMGLYLYGERNLYAFGVGVWLCLAGSLLAFVGGRVKLKSLALPLGIIVLATLLGYFIPYIIINIQENSYQKMFSFPDQAAQILSGDYQGLYISTVE